MSDKLREALEAVLADIAEYERVNNLAPNPGRAFCWDSVARARAALAAEEESGWRTIDSAPRDGTRILLGRFPAPGHEGRFPERTGRIRVDYWRLPKDRAGFLGFGEFNQSWPATHWMPLPPSPKDKTP